MHGSGAVLPNVIADLPGTTCSETVFMVGAHYDTENNTTGADDNASGVAGLLELARVMRDTPLPMSVRFIGFPDEEAGRLGSRKVAEEMRVAGTDVAGMLSLEMIGFTKAGDDLFLGVPNDYLATIANPASTYLGRVFGAAHYRYMPCHTPADTVDTLDMGFLTNSTRSTVAGLVALGTVDGDGDGTPDVCS